MKLGAIRHWIIFQLIFGVHLSAAPISESIKLPNDVSNLPRGSLYVYGDPALDSLIPVHVLGGVSKAGVHYVPVGTDIVTVLSLAGGFGDMAILDKISVRRIGKAEPLIVNLEEVVSRADVEPLKVSFGDTIVVPIEKSIISENTLKVTGFIASLAAIFTTVWLVVHR